MFERVRQQHLAVPPNPRPGRCRRDGATRPMTNTSRRPRSGPVRPTRSRRVLQRPTPWERCQATPRRPEQLIDHLARGLVHGFLDHVLYVWGQRLVVERRPPDHEPGKRRTCHDAEEEQRQSGDQGPNRAAKIPEPGIRGPAEDRRIRLIHFEPVGDNSSAASATAAGQRYQPRNPESRRAVTIAPVKHGTQAYSFTHQRDGRPFPRAPAGGAPSAGSGAAPRLPEAGLWSPL